MKQAEFCYWLQGYFEITGGSPGIAAKQRDIVRNHLELVKQCSKAPITGFCAWLDGALDLAQLDQGICLYEASVEAIKDKLSAEFLHVIDPQMPGDSEVLQAVHDGLQLPSLQQNPHRPHNARC